MLNLVEEDLLVVKRFIIFVVDLRIELCLLTPILEEEVELQKIGLQRIQSVGDFDLGLISHV